MKRSYHPSSSNTKKTKKECCQYSASECFRKDETHILSCHPDKRIDKIIINYSDQGIKPLNLNKQILFYKINKRLNSTLIGNTDFETDDNGIYKMNQLYINLITAFYDKLFNYIEKSSKKEKKELNNMFQIITNLDGENLSPVYELENIQHNKIKFVNNIDIELFKRKIIPKIENNPILNKIFIHLLYNLIGLLGLV